MIEPAILHRAEALTYLVGATAPPGTPANEAWRHACRPEPDAGALLELARLHDMVLPAARAFTGFPTGDGRLATVFAAAARPLILETLGLTRELALLSRRFDAAGIGVAALKGPALSQEIFGTAALRDPGDLDLLVRPQDLAAADRLLGAAGYVREPGWQEDFATGDLARPLTRIFHLGYHHPQSHISVELHWRWFHIEELVPFAATTIWTGTRTVAVGGTAVTVLSPAVQLLYLGFHAAKHECERLKWVNDLAWLLPRLDDAIVDEAADIARHLGILDLFAAPFLTAAKLGTVRLPPPLEALSGRPSARRLARLFLTGLTHPPSRSLIGTWRQRLRWQRTYWRLASHRDNPARLALLRQWARLHLYRRR